MKGHLSRSIHLGTTGPFYKCGWVLEGEGLGVRKSIGIAKVRRETQKPIPTPQHQCFGPEAHRKFQGHKGGTVCSVRQCGEEGMQTRDGRRLGASQTEEGEAPGSLCSSPERGCWAGAAFPRSWAVLPDPYLSERHVNYCHKSPLFQGIQARFCFSQCERT